MKIHALANTALTQHIFIYIIFNLEHALIAVLREFFHGVYLRFWNFSRVFSEVF